MSKLSAYVLTFNSERYLERVLAPLSTLVDDLVVVDSGSNDTTLEIAAQYAQVVEHRALDDFHSQRQFARSLCQHDWVLTLDSDEVPSEGLLSALKTFNPDEADARQIDGFTFERRWFAFGQAVRAVFPVVSPDHVVRLYHRDRFRYDRQRSVHERPMADSRIKFFAGGHLSHYTMNSGIEMRAKLNQYTTLAAQDMYSHGRRTNVLRTSAAALTAFIKWYFLKQGFRDGLVGLRLSGYAARSTWAKYHKLGRMLRKDRRALAADK